MKIENNIDEFSFLLGLFAADGNLDKYRVRFFCSEEEADFFKERIIPMVRRTFKVEPTFRYYNSHCYLLAINSKNVERMFRKIFDYEGKKKYNLKLPKIKFDERSFIAGMIAGDGSVIVTKNASEKRNYPILQFVNSSRVLIDFFCNFLRREKISFYMYRDKDGNYKVTIKGNEFRKFMKSVPIINPVQKTKLEVLQVLGYLPPKTTYKERLKILNKCASGLAWSMT
jgi:hypothetical protein